MPLDDLEAIRKRCEAATKGPWTTEDREGHDDHWATVVTPIEAELPIFEVRGARISNGDNDADFIAHARTDLPALLADLTTARARIAGLEAEVGRLREALKPFSAGPLSVMVTAEAWSRARAALEGKS